MFFVPNNAYDLWNVAILLIEFAKRPALRLTALLIPFEDHSERASQEDQGRFGFEWVWWSQQGTVVLSIVMRKFVSRPSK